MASVIDKNFAPRSKDVRYLGKDFSQLKANLVEFAKYYYPRTYKDFSDSSPGMMFIDMAAYVGDVLSFAIDYQFKEGLIDFATERKNVINLVKYLGYIPKPSRPSVTVLDVYHVVPAKRNSGGSFEPDIRYALRIKNGLEALSSTQTSFITTDVVDFSINTTTSPRVDAVFSRNSSDEPEFYLLKKSTNAYSGKLTSTAFNITEQTPNLSLSLADNNVIKIVDVRDSDNNVWHQVEHLSQDLISLPVENNQLNFENLSTDRLIVPNILKFLRTNRRFVVEVDEKNITRLKFGSSTDSLEEEILVPNSKLLGTGFSNISKYNMTLDPTAFVKSNSYGLSPFNTELTVKYIVGGGIESNANADDITTISKISYDESRSYLSTELSLVNTIKNSVRINNPIPATGGSGEESIVEIKENALANFSAQDRMVTKDDFIARTLNMPSEYGRVAKVCVLSDADLSSRDTQYIPGLIDVDKHVLVDEKHKNFRKIHLDGVNPFGINLYVLTYDENKNLTAINNALAFNLRNYLSKYRILSDRINIIDGFIINIGVNFTISTYSTFNKNEILSNCLTVVKNFFDIENWQFSQPINIGKLELEIATVEGVQSVSDVQITNITDNGYSMVEYDIVAATKNKIVYPPIDPAVFEVKNPNIDIQGKCL